MLPKISYISPEIEKQIAEKYRSLMCQRFDYYFKHLLTILFDQFDFRRDQIMTVEHHRAHALCATLLVPWDEEVLVFSCDGEGDNLSATVSILHRGKIQRIAQTSAEDSLGILYLKVTEYLGMKGNEHEFKVMGMAPYAKSDKAEEVYLILKELLWFSPEDPLAFKARYRMPTIEKRLKNLLYRKRFDAISGGIQRLTEELICEWVKRAIVKTSIGNIALTGGVFMNVKVNQLLGELTEVKKIYVVPSCGDESGAIGAAVEGHLRFAEKHAFLLKPLKSLYLGTQVDNNLDELLKEEGLKKRYHIEYCQDIESRVADLLAKGQVVARLNGKMEWGARALGSRSILANPNNFNIIRIINEKIKNRDFWMPFAASILKERAKDYIVNPKNIDAPYMAITFHTTEMAQVHLPAAIHPYDFTVRPQLVDRAWNPSYHKLISEFEKRTGIGAVLNTSFNLHGEPNVQNLKDAIHTLDHSGLDYLAVDDYLLTKRRA
ncbi:MAG: carbamoyl transferase [Candidatus Peregrinibacteria bacterium GW2011_GWE2_39_6]|nr:MAG: carbamoyl transferase [Candidatus Peregrinibacteria bacterium GW2011_GWE2_39_6]